MFIGLGVNARVLVVFHGISSEILGIPKAAYVGLPIVSLSYAKAFRDTRNL